MSLRRWIPLRLVDNFFDARDLPIVGIGQEADLIVGICSQHLGHGAKLGGKIGMGQKKTHEKKTDLVITPEN